MKTKNNSKQGYNSVQGLRSFKDTLPTKVKKIILKKGDIYSRTLDNWKYLVGADLFKCCYPKSFSNHKSKGKCLTIMVKHGQQIDLEYSKQLIIDKINYFFGYSVVEKIILKTFEEDKLELDNKSKIYATNNIYKKKISDIKNVEIKKSLEKLSKVFKKYE